MIAPRLPRALVVLAYVTLVLGGGGLVRSVGRQMAPYLAGHDAFVAARRREVEAISQWRGEAAAAETVQRAGDAAGERAWTRRWVNLPLGLAHLATSLLLLAGAMRTLARSAWGHSTWRFAAQVAIPYTLVAAAVAYVEAGDARVIYEALSSRLSLQVGVPVEILATYQVAGERLLDLAGALCLCAFYGGTFLYLGKPTVRGLFPRSS